MKSLLLIEAFIKLQIFQYNCSADSQMVDYKSIL